MLRARALRELVLILTGALCASLAAGIAQANVAAAAWPLPIPGTACNPNDNDTATGVNVRCIDGVWLTSRQNYVHSDCITSLTAGADQTPDPEDLYGIETEKYQPGACGASGRGAEAIAAARYLNFRGGARYGNVGGLLPALQYEVNIPNAARTNAPTSLSTTPTRRRAYRPRSEYSR